MPLIFGIESPQCEYMVTERIQISMDQFGRVVLPKEIRNRLGVSPGTEFEVEDRESSILLKPLRRKAKLVKKNGLLVVKGEGPPITVEEVNRTIESSRRCVPKARKDTAPRNITLFGKSVI